MRYVDLHVHTSASDGTFSPEEVVALAAQKGLTAIALTDHDTTAGITRALEAARDLPLEVIPGIELSCVYEGTEIHILGLFVDMDHPQFSREIEDLRRIREARNDEMIRRFCAAGMEITREDLKEGCGETVITRAHFARTLVKKGYVRTLEQAFKQYLQYGGAFCMRKETVTPEHALRILTESHAFPALAHPGQYKLGEAGNEALISYLKDLGLRGIEVYHPSQSPYESGKLKNLAVRHGLLPTGGSDFHGAAKPDIQIGTGRGGLRVSALLLEDIKKIMAG